MQSTSGQGALRPTSPPRTPLSAIRAAAGLPVVVGFGITTPEAAQAVASVADGSVVGSAIVRLIGEGRPLAEVLTFVESLAAAVHGKAPQDRVAVPEAPPTSSAPLPDAEAAAAAGADADAPGQG